MRTTGEIKGLKSSSRRAARRSSMVPSDVVLQDLRRIGSRLRAGARRVLRENLGELSRMGLDVVESVAYLGCAFLNAMLEEAPGVKAELTQQVERFIRGKDLDTTDRGGRGGSSRSRSGRRRGEGGRGPVEAAPRRGRAGGRGTV